jgi:hypothetical protein
VLKLFSSSKSHRIYRQKAYTHSHRNDEVNAIKYVGAFFLAHKDATWGRQHRRTGKQADHAGKVSPKHALHTSVFAHHIVPARRTDDSSANYNVTFAPRFQEITSHKSRITLVSISNPGD